MLTVLGLFFVMTCALLYLALAPDKRDEAPDQRGATVPQVVQRLELLTPRVEKQRMVEVRRDVALVSRILNGLKEDQIACIAPSPAEKKKLIQNFKVLLPDSAAFGSEADNTAVLGNDRLIKQTNTLLAIAKEKRRHVSTHLHQIELTMNTLGDKFLTRFARAKKELEDEMLQMASDIVAECSKQKKRLRSKYPHLSNYEFIDEAINDKFTISPYTYGTAVTPVTRQFTPEKPALIPGLVSEYHQA